MIKVHALLVSCPFTVSERMFRIIVIPALIGAWVSSGYWVFHAFQ